MNRLLLFVFVIAALIFSGITAPETAEAMPFSAVRYPKTAHSAIALSQN